MDILEFKDAIMDYLSKTNTDNTNYCLSEHDIKQIEKLTKSKYETWD